jgi:hypothetical protein
MFSHLLCKKKNTIYKILIFFTSSLYGCETWCLIQREEHRLMEFENKVLTRMFELKREEVAGKEEIAY